jgi:threonine dehydrogenase-like Zn-dependent dehydrogenase
VDLISNALRTIRFLNQARARKGIHYSQIITHGFPFAKLLDAFKFAEEGKEEAIKVMIGFDS